ncbi:MAG: hypothetical protein ORN98_10005 [Alphaproteobacteria bacterium]|nr:hypothetical protein [Alphaproteobacteria bacterium]
MSSYLRHPPNPRLTTLVGDRPPPRFAHLHSKWTANLRAGDTAKFLI